MAGETTARRGLPFFRRRAPEPPPRLRLDDVRRRLELFLAGVYGHAVPLGVAAPAGRPRFWDWVRRRPAPEPRASTEDGRVLLPPDLEELAEVGGYARFQLLAIGQAERMARGVDAFAPPPEAPLERDLYLLLESTAADAAIARAAPGLVPALRAERAAALARRPPLDSLGAPERAVETMIRRVLSADPQAPPAELAAGESPAASAARAKEVASAIPGAGRYRGVESVAAWGTVIHRAPPSQSALSYAGQIKLNLIANAHSRGAATDQGGQQQAQLWEEGDQPQENPSPGAQGNEQRAAGSGGAGEGEGAVGVAEEPARDDELHDEDPAATRAQPRKRARDRERDVFAYPEWDYRAGRYYEKGATVRMAPPLEGGDAWPNAVLAEHAALIRQLRERFERLRARRTRLNQQRDGDELDLGACVRALVDLRAGEAMDDRLYAATLPARRGVAITLLVDISGSTHETIGKERIIDLEKVSLLLTSQALDALGDPYAVVTFSGKGPGNVRLRRVKDFAERNGEVVRRRIAALEPEGFTRLGAAVRHATALLSRTDAGHRLLLIISDGKPNDEDSYEGRYGVEDSRQAILEARSAGVYPFCITVDQKGAAYLPRIFGTAGHMIVRDAGQLPAALSRAVRNLLAR